ncbi:DUF488 family protein [Luteolibacter ambystomatis]|uniref:DUF488 family protein n=1 Tax=Luteolibacter ambystomatis TaxID=2824561 RepID=A0A975G8X6_9BACT|nr:DUF488 family protein [Luteolibacter ambystomatis]QUE51529.1 DUF488 family protein [Luteolibacter ambystomatis]
MAHTISTYRYGEAIGLPGISLGVTRQPPRGIRREDYWKKGYCDVWLPVLAPSKELVKAYLGGGMTFATFSRRYRAEMKKGDARHVIDLVVAMAGKGPVHLGCFCEDESRCHRAVLQKLVMDAMRDLPKKSSVFKGYASPPCSMPEIAD